MSFLCIWLERGFFLQLKTIARYIQACRYCNDLTSKKNPFDNLLETKYRIILYSNYDILQYALNIMHVPKLKFDLIE